MKKTFSRAFLGIFLLAVIGVQCTLLNAAPAVKDPFQEAVAKLSDKNDSKRRAGAEALSELRNPAAAPHLRKLLVDPSPQVRAAAVDALGILRVQGITQEIAGILIDDKDPAVRQTAAIALGYIGDRTAVPALLKSLKSPHDGTRFASVNTLGILRDASAVPDLVKELKNPDQKMRNSVAFTLGKIQDKSAVPPLLEALKISRSTAPVEGGKPQTDVMVAGSVLRALGDIGDKSVLPQVKPYLNDPDSRVKICAAHSLFLLGDKSGVPVARKYLKDKDTAVRKMSVDVLGVMGDAQDLETLKTMKSDPDPQVQQALNIALKRLTQNFEASKPKPKPAAAPAQKAPAVKKKSK